MTVLAETWRPRFIAILRDTSNVRLAANGAGVDRSTAYRARERSAEFRKQWEDAIEDAVDVLEAEAWKRSRATSDVLLIFLLKAHRPLKYREPVTRHEISGDKDNPVAVDVTFHSVIDTVYGNDSGN